MLEKKLTGLSSTQNIGSITTFFAIVKRKLSLLSQFNPDRWFVARVSAIGSPLGEVWSEVLFWLTRSNKTTAYFRQP